MEGGPTAMPSISSRLSALCAKIQGLAVPGTDMTLRRVSMACICAAMQDLGNVAAPSSRRKYPTTPISTSQFVVEEGGVHGEGRRGCVIMVSHRATRKTFAMKILFLEPYEREDGDEEEEVDIFNLHVLREACFMAACRGHPSLVRFHAVCRDPGNDRCCLLTEHVGPSLREVLAQRQRRGGRPFPEHEVRRMMRQVVCGAKAMHDRGIVHGGISSENVLVGAGGCDAVVVKIGGFGQATCTSRPDVPLCGKIARDQRAPPEELLKGHGCALGSDECIDSWSIGCLMAELLTGRALFQVTEHEDEEDQLYKIFDVLGIPDKAEMKDIEPQDLDLAKEVHKWRAQRGIGKLRSGSRLRKRVPREFLSDDGFTVLQGLLACNPKKRLTAGAALQLPWLANDDDNSPAGAGVVSQQIVINAPILLRQWPFAWLLTCVLALLFLVAYVCVGGRRY